MSNLCPMCQRKYGTIDSDDASETCVMCGQFKRKIVALRPEFMTVKGIASLVMTSASRNDDDPPIVFLMG